MPCSEDVVMPGGVAGEPAVSLEEICLQNVMHGSAKMNHSICYPEGTVDHDDISVVDSLCHFLGFKSCIAYLPDGSLSGRTQQDQVYCAAE